MNKIVIALLAGIGLIVTLALLSVFIGSIVWLLWNWIVVAEFVALPKLSWPFCVAVTWMSNILFKRSTSIKLKD
jgi:hypothetical protein